MESAFRGFRDSPPDPPRIWAQKWAVQGQIIRRPITTSLHEDGQESGSGDSGAGDAGTGAGADPLGPYSGGWGGVAGQLAAQQIRRAKPPRPRPAGPRGPGHCRTVRRTTGRETSLRLDYGRWGVALRRACDLEAGSRPAGGDPVQGGRVRARGWAGGVAAPAWEMGCHPFLLFLRTASHRRGLMVEGE